MKLDGGGQKCIKEKSRCLRWDAPGARASQVRLY